MLRGKALDIVKYLMEQPKDKTWELKEVRKHRSLNANAYFHVLCNMISSLPHMGTMTEVKNQLVADWGVKDEIGHIIMKDDVPWKRLDSIHLRPTTHTQTMNNGQLYRVYEVMKPTHLYNTKEMAHLIDGAIQDAKDAGIPDLELITPNEKARMLYLWGKHEEQKNESVRD